MRAGKLRQRTAVLHLQLLGVWRRRAERDADVVGDLVAGDRQHGGVADRAATEHRDVGRTGADVDQADAEIALVGQQRRVARREVLQDQLVDLETAGFDALVDVLRRRDRAGDDMDLGFEADAVHADRIMDAFAAIDDEFLRDHMQDLLVGGDCDRARGVDHAVDIAIGDAAGTHRRNAGRIEAADVRTGDAHVNRLCAAVGHVLGVLDRALDRLRRQFDIDDVTAVHAARGRLAEADDLDAAFR